MVFQCDLTGKRRLCGNKVSHANKKSRTTQKPNLKSKVIFDPVSGKKIRLKVATSTIRTLDKLGSLSKYLKKNSHLFTLD